MTDALMASHARLGASSGSRGGKAVVRKPPSVTVRRDGEALLCTIDGKQFKVTKMQRMLPGSNQWQDLDVNGDMETLGNLDVLAQRVQTLATILQDQGQLDLSNAKSFNVVGTRTISKDGTKSPIAFHQFVWRPEGADADSHLEIRPETLPEALRPVVQHSMKSVENAFSKAADSAKLIEGPPASKAGKKGKTGHSDKGKKTDRSKHPARKRRGLATPLRGSTIDCGGGGDCMALSLAQAMINRDGMPVAIGRRAGLALELRHRAAENLRNNRAFADNEHLFYRVWTAADLLVRQTAGLERNKDYQALQRAILSGNPQDVADRRAFVTAYANLIEFEGVWLDEVFAAALGEPIAIVETIDEGSGPQNIITSRYLTIGPRTYGLEDPAVLFIWSSGENGHYQLIDRTHPSFTGAGLAQPGIIERFKDGLRNELTNYLGLVAANADTASGLADVNQRRLNELQNRILSLKENDAQVYGELFNFLVAKGLSPDGIDDDHAAEALAQKILFDLGSALDKQAYVLELSNALLGLD
jgi:hypothetical protein